jgi:hypothetical protein
MNTQQLNSTSIFEHPKMSISKLVMSRYISQLKIPIKRMAYMEAIEAHCLAETKTKIKWVIKITLIKYLKRLLKLLTFQTIETFSFSHWPF